MMGGPIKGMSWNQMNASMIKGESVRLGEAAEKRTRDYEASLSHGAARFFKCVFSLGINEIWRACRTSNYESDMKNIAKSAENFYRALAPKYGEDRVNGIPTQRYEENTCEAEIAECKVSVTRNVDGTGSVTVPGKDGGEYDIKDCDKLRTEIELDVMRHAKYFKPTFVRTLIAVHKSVIDNDAFARDHDSQKCETKGLVTRTVGSEDRVNLGLRSGTEALRRNREDLNAVPGIEETKLPLEAAKEHLQDMLAAFYEGTLALPPEVGRTLDLEIGTQLVDKVLGGEITDGKKLLAFLDKGAKKAHLADAESQKLFAQFEKAVAGHNAEVGHIAIEPTYAQKLAEKGGAFVPQGEAKKVHDFVADLVLNEDAYDYDREVSRGERTGARLNRLVGKNTALVAEMMDPQNRARMLSTLDPSMRDVVEKRLLAPLEEDFRKENAEKPGLSRETYLERKVRSVRSDEAETRQLMGTRDIDSFATVELDALGNDPRVLKNERLNKLHEKHEYFGSDEARAELQKALDFFGTIEADIDAGIKDACEKLQAQVSAKLDTVLRTDSAKGGLSAEELKNLSLGEIQKAYAQEQELELVKKTLNVYFKEMPQIAQRQMIAAQTRHCMSRDANGNEASEGARLGALLKGAGPVMQKMLQGVNPQKITDPDVQLALADMKDNLEPIPETAIRAYLYDIIQQSKTSENPIASIRVEKSLGQASVGQALLCTLKREGLAEEKVVIKLLRPNANLSARREHDIFKQVAQEIGNGMEATFKGRYKAIKEELDLSSEARNAQRAGQVYRYGGQTYNDQPFTNVTSAGLAPGFKPTVSTMVQECAEGVTLKKMLSEEMVDLGGKDVVTLREMQAKLQKTHASLTNLSYMWTQEGLFGAGFYHGDLHEGNIVIDGNGKATVIDFGNATSLDANGRINVIRVVSGMAVSDSGLFLKGIENLLQSVASKTAFRENRAAIAEKIGALLSPAHKGLADTALRLDLALRILQMDFKIEVPSAVHNFMESQRRLSDAMENTEAKLQAVNAALREKGEVAEDVRLPSMMKCLVDVVKHNIGADLLKAIGLRNAKTVYNSIRDDLQAVDNPKAAPENIIQA